ncbi:MAG: hypothetical protein HYU75_24675 [Betaproteobacteria bacterium]|nr:hypothetical protein [Betaproteobacteria bacterium]
MTGINIVHVPYKGGAPATSDVVAGRVLMTFDGAGLLQPLVKKGNLRPLGVSTLKRLSIAPDVPTIAEAGVPGYTASSWFGVFAPASTPENVIAKLHAEFVKALQVPDLRTRLLDLGFESVGSTPEEFADYWRAEAVKWTNVIKKAGIRVN